MPSEQQILAADKTEDRIPRRCTNCGKWKARDQFAGNRSRKDSLSTHCRQCLRIAQYERYHERGGKDVQAAYHARPEVKDHRREYDRGRKEKRKAGKLAYGKSPRGKVVACRNKARRMLRLAATPGRRAELEARIAECDREWARLDAVRETKRTAELPAKVTRPRVRECGKSPARGIYLTPAGTFEVRVSVGKARSVRGGTFATVDGAKDAANELAFRLRGERNYAVPREERRRA
jgi:hypothetical protein